MNNHSYYCKPNAHVLEYESPGASRSEPKRQNLSDDKPRITEKENKTKFINKNYTDQSRMWSSLNEDCLIHLCQFLSYWDLDNLARTSPKLADFVEGNVFAKRARKCLLFTEYPSIRNNYLDSITLSTFSDDMRNLGEHLTHLNVSGARFDMQYGTHFVQEILTKCPQLTSLRLHKMPISLRCGRKLPDGGQLPQLKELCLSSCEYVDTNWHTFINQLSGLQSLVLHNSMPPQWVREGIKCNQLRVLSVHENIAQHTMVGMIMASRDTLRVLEFELFDTSSNGVIFEKATQQLMNLQTLSVYNISQRISTVKLLPVYWQLRTLIVRKYDVFAVNFMTRLGAGPHAVENIVLLKPTKAKAVCDLVARFRTKLLKLDIHELKEVDNVFDLIPLFYMPRLQKLTLSFCKLSLEPVLLTAIRGCIELNHVVVWQSTHLGKLSVELVVKTLRESANGGNRRLRLEFYGCLGLSIMYDDDFLHQNADILELVANNTAFRDGVGMSDIEEYMIKPVPIYGL